MSKPFLSLILASLLGWCFTLPPVATYADQSEPRLEEYDVYTALISELHLSKKVKLIVIEDKTTDNHALKPLFNLEVKYVLVSKSDLADAFGKGPDVWKTFYEKYPNSSGFIRLSSVTFNPEKDQAHVVIENHCGWHCGSGEFIELIKKSGKWIIQTKKLIWVS